MSKYTTTGSADGRSGTTFAADTHASASRALTYWKYPVSTGYSMYRTCASSVPSPSTHGSR
jgi:hypothetical protein